MLTTATIERLLKPYTYSVADRTPICANRRKRGEIEQAALDLIRKDGFVNSESLAGRLGGTVNAAHKMLMKMTLAGLIRQEKRAIQHRGKDGKTNNTVVAIYKGLQ